MLGVDPVYFILWVVFPTTSFGIVHKNLASSPIEEENDIPELGTELEPLATGQAQKETDRQLRLIGIPLKTHSYYLSAPGPTLHPSASVGSRIPRDVTGPVDLPASTAPPADPAASGSSSSISASVSSSVLTSVSLSISSLLETEFTSTLDDFSSSSSSAVTSANLAGSSVASASAQQAISSANSRLSAASSSISSLLDVITTANAILIIESSASSAIQAAQSSAQSAISAAEASASAAAAASSGVNLDVGQFVGVVVAIFISSVIISVLATTFIFRYRKKRTEMSPKALGSPVQTLHPRHDLVSPIHTVRVTSGRNEGQPTDGQSDVMVTSPLSSRSPHDHVHSVSPLSDDQPISSGLGHEFYSTGAHETVPKEGGVPEKFSLTQKRGDDGQQRMQVERVGSYNPSLHRLFSTAREGQVPAMRNQPVEAEGSEVAGDFSGFLVPPIPARISSLNPYQGPLTLNPIQQPFSVAGTSFLSTSFSDEAPYDEEQPQTQLFHPHNLTRQKPSRLPVSRFSVTPLPPPSVSDDSRSESNTVTQQLAPESPGIQGEAPQPSPLRGPPPSPSLLRSPIPRRPSQSANLASFEPQLPRTPKETTFSLFPRPSSH
ncbi:hypothetical protein F5Y16DRAFT_108552 [Xylariaceae sp. FL0255]|nr:hypothetical protein F5Y16DRAFT_108552 [Xylariaceae sp. FL0255]